MRQASLLWPLDKEITEEIIKVRSEIRRVNNEDIKQVELAEKSFFYLKSFLPDYFLSLFIVIISLVSIFKFSYGYKKKEKLFSKINLSLIIILTFLFAQNYLVTYTKDGRLRLSDKFEDFQKRESIVLVEGIKGYSAPNSNSQLSFLLKKGEEINIYTNNDSWLEVENSSSRRGWIKGTEGLYILKR